VTGVQYVIVVGTGIPEATKRFPFFPLIPREASKRLGVPIFDRGTGSKPDRLKSGSLQADLFLYRVILLRASACKHWVPISRRGERGFGTLRKTRLRL